MNQVWSFFLTLQPLMTSKFEFEISLTGDNVKNYESNVANLNQEPEGFALWYLRSKPRLDEQMGSLFGYKVSEA